METGDVVFTYEGKRHHIKGRFKPMLRGLDKEKYIVTKSDDSPVDPEAQYFILRIDKDPLARMALKLYARLIRNKNIVEYLEPRLGHDIRQWLVDTLETPGGKAEYEMLTRAEIEGVEI